MGVDLVRGDPHGAATLALVQAALNGAQLDILHIDASHVEEDALGDWRMYRPLVRSGGMIILHDAFKTSASDKKGDAVKEAIDILKVEEGRKVVRWRWIQQMRDNNSAGPGICVAEIS